MRRDGGGRRRREILVGLGSGLVAGLAGCGGDGGDPTPTPGSGDGGNGGTGGTPTPTPEPATPTDASTPTPEPPTETGRPTATPVPVEQETLEPAIADRVNEVRKANGSGFVGWDADLHEIAREHCWDMIQNEYVAHEDPNGRDWADRYTGADYSCTLEAAGTNRKGGECIARVTYGDPPPVRDIAVEVVSRLREDTAGGGLLADQWTVQGIGVAIDPTVSNTDIYVTQNFC
jgi:uncharacterized protein YkwD